MPAAGKVRSPAGVAFLGPPLGSCVTSVELQHSLELPQKVCADKDLPPKPLVSNVNQSASLAPWLLRKFSFTAQSKLMRNSLIWHSLIEFFDLMSTYCQENRYRVRVIGPECGSNASQRAA